MNTLIVKDLVSNSSSNLEGNILFEKLVIAAHSNEKLILHIDSELIMSSSFLNSSIGAFLEEFGLVKFKELIKFKGSKNQFERLSTYIKKYENVYLA